ncbi:MAG: energy transducer TonB [Bryobacteraceae bacterium]
MTGPSKPSVLCSALLHAGAIALVLILTTGNPPPIALVPHAIFLRDTWSMPPIPALRGGGGGGGQRALTPPSKGRPPKPDRRVFRPPVASIRETEPMLPVEPAILATVAMPVFDLPDFGDPRGVDGPLSGGPGSGGGFGNGKEGGIGNGKGPSFGAGAGSGGTGGEGAVFTQPVLLTKKEPEYTDEARKVRLQGTVALIIEIDSQGLPRDIRVWQSLGLGLDERAVEAVRNWRFRPATRNGKPVPSSARVDVNFRLL